MSAAEQSPEACATAGARWLPAYVGLGSNLDEPASQVVRAFDALAALPETTLVARSGLWRSAPMGPVAQPDFINAVAGLLTRLDPPTLLRELKALEQRLGRETPVVRWGPRRIDLDLLVHGQARIEEPGALALPHPGIAARAFVLAPLAEICPDLLVPGASRVSRLLAQVDAEGLHRVDDAFAATRP